MKSSRSTVSYQSVCYGSSNDGAHCVRQCYSTVGNSYKAHIEAKLQIGKHGSRYIEHQVNKQARQTKQNKQTKQTTTTTKAKVQGILNSHVQPGSKMFTLFARMTYKLQSQWSTQHTWLSIDDLSIQKKKKTYLPSHVIIKRF